VVEIDLIRNTLSRVAPGTALREGLERILRGNTGGLVVLGHDRTVESISSGGFALDIDFSATLLRELAKMDGAIILTSDLTRIVRAAVQLVPDSSIPTEESGTRHRTAQRVSIQTGHPVVSVSQSMKIVAIYVGGKRHVLEDSSAILSRANQALATLERYKSRLDQVSGTLASLEIEDLVTVRDVAIVAQRLEMVRRIASEISGYVVELGSDGRLLKLQLDELISGVDRERELIVRDYITPGRNKERRVESMLSQLDTLSPDDLVDITAIARAMGLMPDGETAERSISTRGYRLMARIPRLPTPIMERIVEHFGTLQKLLAAGVDDLQNVEGVGELRARAVHEGLSRLAESTILERYV
jgi:diadenylate cyclase